MQRITSNGAGLAKHWVHVNVLHEWCFDAKFCNSSLERHKLSRSITLVRSKCDRNHQKYVFNSGLWGIKVSHSFSVFCVKQSNQQSELERHTSGLIIWNVLIRVMTRMKIDSRSGWVNLRQHTLSNHWEKCFWASANQFVVSIISTHGDLCQ